MSWAIWLASLQKRFNLVIENLLISTTDLLSGTAHPQTRFQSRNRESSNFNSGSEELLGGGGGGFNLVIENLLISTNSIKKYNNYF